MDDLRDNVLKAKTDDETFSLLVEENRSWILKCASQAAHRYVTESDDEWSAALMAFSEAVQSYDES